MNIEFGKLLRQYRKLNGLSQSVLRNMLDKQGYSFTESAISKWENELHVPKAEVVEVLEDILMPRSIGLLLRAAGYGSEAEMRFPSSEIVRQQMSQEDKELSLTTLILASNLEKYHSEPIGPNPLGNQYRVGDRVYGEFDWESDVRPIVDVDFEKIDKTTALDVLSHLQANDEFPELNGITDWADLTDDKISLTLVERLRLKAYRGYF